MSTMKDSGIPWIGKIPENWKVSKLKYFVDCYDGKRVPVDASLRNSGPYPYWGAGSIMDYVDDYLFDEELVLLGEDGAPFFDYTRPVAFYVNEKVWVNNHIHVLKPHASIDIKYLIHYLNNVDYKSYINGSILNKLTQTNMNSIAFVFPDKEEQKRIANYLDAECARIDAVMEQTRASIEEYKKLKQSIITEAVTKGIRPNRPMKDSGIDWIGQIPADWDTLRKLSYACNKSISYGIVKLFEPDDENGVKVLRCSDIREGIIIPDNIRTVTQKVSQEYNRTVLSGGEVVINVRGTLGGCAVVPMDMRGYNIAREVAMVSVSNCLANRYLMYYLLSKAFLIYEERHLAGSVYVGLNIEMLSACPIPLPCLGEQEEIIRYLDNKCQAIDIMISSKERFLSEMESYKKSLIFEYITGKKEV